MKVILEELEDFDFSSDTTDNVKIEYDGTGEDVFFADETNVKEEEEINLSTQDVISLIAEVLNGDNILYSPNPINDDISIIKEIEQRIKTFFGIEMDLVDIVYNNQDIKEFLILVRYGIIRFTNDDIVKKETIFYIPREQVGVITVNIGGKQLYKGKPIISTYNKNVVDQIFNEFFGCDDVSIVDRVNKTKFMVKPDKYEMQVELISFSNLEIATMIMDGEIREEDIEMLPPNRQKRIKQIIELNKF